MFHDLSTQIGLSTFVPSSFKIKIALVFIDAGAFATIYSRFPVGKSWTTCLVEQIK